MYACQNFCLCDIPTWANKYQNKKHIQASCLLHCDFPKILLMLVLI